MSKSKTSSRRALANPVHLKPFAEGKELLRVVVETPKGSRNKIVFNTDECVFELKKVLPAGMAFPYDFGFVRRPKLTTAIPSTFWC